MGRLGSYLELYFLPRIGGPPYCSRLVSIGCIYQYSTQIYPDTIIPIELAAIHKVPSAASLRTTETYLGDFPGVTSDVDLSAFRIVVNVVHTFSWLFSSMITCF